MSLLLHRGTLRFEAGEVTRTVDGDTRLPDGFDVAAVEDLLVRLSVDEHQVGESTFGDDAAVADVEDLGRNRGRSGQRFSRRKPRLDEQLELAVHARSVDHARVHRVGAGENGDAGLVETAHGVPAKVDGEVLDRKST